jgi:hypothetical protein
MLLKRHAERTSSQNHCLSVQDCETSSIDHRQLDPDRGDLQVVNGWRNSGEKGLRLVRTVSQNHFERSKMSLD